MLTPQSATSLSATTVESPETVWSFNWCYCVTTDGHGVVSLHKTKASAWRAMNAFRNALFLKEHANEKWAPKRLRTFRKGNKYMWDTAHSFTEHKVLP